MAQTVFAVTPILVDVDAGRPRPKIRWDIWALLIAGVVTLVYGIQLSNNPIILTGGMLIFIATTLLTEAPNNVSSGYLERVSSTQVRAGSANLEASHRDR